MWWTLVAAMAADVPEGYDAVVKALANRHAEPCAVVEALSPEPVQALQKVIAEVPYPPWSAMRAAECLTRGHALEVRADLLRWVGEPELAGLGRQTLALLPQLPEEVAVEVGRKALEGPLAKVATERIAADERPAVRALGVTP